MFSKGSFQLTILVFILMNDKTTTAQSPCTNANYQDTTLKLLKDQAIGHSFMDLTSYGQDRILLNRFEASDVVLSPDGHYVYVVFDNIYQIGAFCTPLGRLSNCTDQLFSWPNASLNSQDSSFEGIAYEPVNGRYFVVQETVPTNAKGIFRSNIFELSIAMNRAQPLQQVDSCVVSWTFGSKNKGFEGLEAVYHQRTGQTYLLALCEANKCDHKSNSTNDGRIVVLEKKRTTDGVCSWEPMGTFDLPSSVRFSDYSAMSIYPSKTKQLPTYIAVVSQTNSQLWIGRIDEIDERPYFDVSKLKKSVVYDFPRSTETASECQIKYCNVEGVAWQGKNQLVLVSDKAKDDQDIHCIEKDQSIHYFALPDNLSK
ncbi:unnamed protein product [Adineta ricciae]|uniref:Phytase-like domain-containing protein n=1 Tax=Adineta ricciae TaxID=249248 RepID=A0A815RFH1_ADIRI|nr:unnamed protein product [Adineta ricciae]CAF1476414.1 unnamed protein product [Adineta ricciae]